PLAIGQVETNRARRLLQQRLVAATRKLLEEVLGRVRHAPSLHSSVLTMIRPTRWCVSTAPDQSTIAFARSSLVGSSARWTVPHANCAFVPLIVLPPSICTTAARRPIV